MLCRGKRLLVLSVTEGVCHLRGHLLLAGGKGPGGIVHLRAPPTSGAVCGLCVEVFLGRIWRFCTEVRVGADLASVAMEGLMGTLF